MDGSVTTNTFAGRDIVTTIINESHRAYTRDTLHELRPINENFQGREKEIGDILSFIRERAQQGGAVTITSSIAGMGGIGQTELANLIGHALAKDFPDSQLFVELGAHSLNPRTPAQALQSVVAKFEPEAKLPTEDTELRNLYVTKLSDKHALVILDDVRSDDDVVKLLSSRGALPSSPRARTSLPANGCGWMRYHVMNPSPCCAAIAPTLPTRKPANWRGYAPTCPSR